MFNAIIRADRLEEALDSVTVLVDESKINLNEDGLVIRAIDGANVGMADLSLFESAFESYESDGGIIGIQLWKLEDVVNFADSDDLIHFELDEETRTLNVKVNGLTYDISLIDPDSIRQEPDIPNIDLPGEFVFEADQLRQGAQAASLVSDHIKFKSGKSEADENVLLMVAEGDTDNVEYEIEESDMINATFGEINSLYSLDYLEEMVKTIPNKREVRVELGEEFPTKIHFDIADSEGNTTYMIAPRIDNN